MIDNIFTNEQVIVLDELKGEICSRRSDINPINFVFALTKSDALRRTHYIFSTTENIYLPLL